MKLRLCTYVSLKHLKFLRSHVDTDIYLIFDMHFFKQNRIRIPCVSSRRIESHLKIGMFEYIVGPHPIQYELSLIGDPHDVISHGVRQQPALVDQLDEGEPRVLLQTVLPLLGAEQHHEFHH